ncbi:family 43 glycosylhydrolase [Vibrio gazogenes]|uniref:Beta-xylosidase, GH43 family n=1 Tax=Vibrio gazogenes DSM 21264 = NBRC 103151 TaxID=1123492 RepID=A0A1M5BM61_VIBGA|nr:glycoside hydrolase family 43 protein [Vibrio gazogenes]USP13742.1 glycoside hydrolase family 43 protein [Vibrio gazogenes]SHF43588.1 Beta-xylosidase, GH43 family [Vibrio gazogenes DSM 21264] [Vibrio gazogenes DSM 21264 = NBRC 103151]SJN56522.1 Extracellular exo-alpha-(1->5)-L-arabinofuranosidase precursor [Vibrio gazogenes]
MVFKIKNPVIEQRADPHVYLHHDGYYYFTASVPEYDRIELRRAKTLAGLAATDEIVTVWHKPDHGPYSDLIWAPEIHAIDGSWYIYFAAAPSREIKDGLFQHRMYVIRCDGENPLAEPWTFCGQVDSGIDAFCLDATTFEHRGTRYYVWAQKEQEIAGNSNLYIAEMLSPTTLKLPGTRLSIPEFDWETQGFMVNEGPYVLIRHGKVWLTYSASATDERYCMGLLQADEDADLLNPENWYKSPHPVFVTNVSDHVFGPGHSCFTQDEQGNDILVYHARDYTEIEGDPLWDPNRHTRMKQVLWDGEQLVLGQAE